MAKYNKKLVKQVLDASHDYGSSKPHTTLRPESPLNQSESKLQRNNSESKIQQEIVRWYKNTYCLKHHNPRSMIFSIPNESNGSRSMKLIQTGMYPGCADLMIGHAVKPGSRGSQFEELIWIFIECKTPIGIQSITQQYFEAHCKQMGIPYHIVRSLDDFKDIINNF